VPPGALVSAIKVGDLVVVVKPTACCGAADHVGEIFRVAEILTLEGICRHCFRLPPPELGADYDTVHTNGGYSLSNLKRIPPLDELERDQIVKELSA
jgi:hypothetical protein